MAAPASLIGRLRDRLRGRGDTEHEMSLNRLAFALIIVVFLVIVGSNRTFNSLAGMAIYTMLALGVLAHIVIRPAVCPPRRLCALGLDFGFLSWQLHTGGEPVAAFFPLYLWITFGNGFRFGITWLRISMLAGSASFAAVVASTPFWFDHLPLAVGLEVGLIILPLYSGTLIRRLSEAKRQAEDASQAKTLFLASVSHELRTPLTAIIGMGGLLQASPLNREQREMTRTVRDAAKSLLTLIDSILDLSRIEAGRLPQEPVEFDLLDLLAEIRGLVLAQARAKNLTVSIHVTTRAPVALRGSRNHLHEILLNLAGNAVKFTESGGILLYADLDETRVNPDGDAIGLRIDVADTGIGIAPEAHGRIFESFTQADSTILNRYGGTGLGLSIAKRLAQSLGGDLDLESEVGRGTRFKLNVAFGQTEMRWPLLPDKLIAIVLLDGSENTARTAQRLTEAGLHVTRAKTFEQAFARADRGDREWDGRVLPVAVGPAQATLLREFEAVRRLHGQAEPCPAILVGDPAEVRDAEWNFVSVVGLNAPVSDLRFAAHVALAAGVRRYDRAEDLAETAPPTPSRRVLIADDNRVNQRVLSKILEQAGHVTRVVSDGEAALDMLESTAEHFDIVLMDVNMPVLDGLEATKLYRFMALGRPHLPIVALTADATARMAEICTDAGMDACVTKPVEPSALLKLVADLTQHAGQAAAAPRGTTEVADAREQSAPIIEDNTLENLRSLGGPEFVSSLINDFIEEAEAIVHRLIASAKEGDIVSFHAHRHALRSTAGNMGARALLQTSESFVFFESKGLSSSSEDIATRMAAEFDRTRKALNARKTLTVVGGGRS